MVRGAMTDVRVFIGAARMKPSKHYLRELERAKRWMVDHNIVPLMQRINVKKP